MKTILLIHILPMMTNARTLFGQFVPKQIASTQSKFDDQVLSFVVDFGGKSNNERDLQDRASWHPSPKVHHQNLDVPVYRPKNPRVHDHRHAVSKWVNKMLHKKKGAHVRPKSWKHQNEQAKSQYSVPQYKPRKKPHSSNGRHQSNPTKAHAQQQHKFSDEEIKVPKQYKVANQEKEKTSEPSYEKKSYHFKYDVNEEGHFGHEEKADGEEVRGEFVIDKDAFSLQTKYNVLPTTGFQSETMYSINLA